MQTRLMPVKLVIFDCDGVLVDSELLTNTIFRDMLSAVGFELTLEEMFDQFVGRSSAGVKALVVERLGTEPPAGFYETFAQRCAAAFADRLEPVRGITAALDAIHYPTCIASSGDHEKMQLTLGVTGLYDRFKGRIFSATEVERGKPWPDIYLHAARQTGVEPGHCVVVEDSPAGVTAGVAAGMRVIGYAERTLKAKLVAAGAHCVIDDMADLSGTIAAL